jgi:hypothetical protein
LLTLIDDGVRLEWRQTQTTDLVSFRRIATDVEVLPLEWLELPFERIAGARIAGGWWRSRLELTVTDAADLEGVPGARGATLPLRIELLDRKLARAVAATIAGQLD